MRGLGGPFPWRVPSDAARLGGAMQQPPAPAAALPVRHIKLSASRSAFHYVEVCVSAFQNGETELEISGLGAGS